MKMKIALLFPVPRVVGEEELKQTAELALKNVRMAKNEDTEVIPCFPERGVVSPEEHCYRYLVYRADREMYEAAIQIERDGYDAIMLFCCFEPAIMQMRQALTVILSGK